MLTQTQLAAKRHERTMRSRAKAKGRATAYGRLLEGNARRREKTAAWLRDLGAVHQKAQQDENALTKQHVELQRVKAKTVAKPGLIGRIKSFFGRGR